MKTSCSQFHLILLQQGDITWHSSGQWNTCRNQFKNILNYTLLPFLCIHPSENRDSNWYLYTHVYSSILHKSQKVETVEVSINRWIDRQNVVYIHTMEYYPAIKRKEIMIYASTGMKLGNIMLSKISQTQEDKYCMVPFI